MWKGRVLLWVVCVVPSPVLSAGAPKPSYHPLGSGSRPRFLVYPRLRPST